MCVCAAREWWWWFYVWWWDCYYLLLILISITHMWCAREMFKMHALLYLIGFWKCCSALHFIACQHNWFELWFDSSNEYCPCCMVRFSAIIATTGRSELFWRVERIKKKCYNKIWFHFGLVKFQLNFSSAYDFFIKKGSQAQLDSMGQYFEIRQKMKINRAVLFSLSVFNIQQIRISFQLNSKVKTNKTYEFPFDEHFQMLFKKYELLQSFLLNFCLFHSDKIKKNI